MAEPDARPRSIVVTGASSGTGRAVCLRLARAGVGIVMHGRARRENADRVADEVRAAGAQARVVMGDMARDETAASVVETAARAFGGLDVLVHCAGFSDSRRFGVLDADGFAVCQQAMNGAFFRLVTAALPHLERARDGRVVAVSTFAAHALRNDLPLYPASAAAKAAMEAQARCLAVQLAPKGVTVNCVAPGYIQKESGAHTSLTPAQWQAILKPIAMGRVARPDEIAAAICFLASPDASYITGQVVHVNGGLFA